MKRITILIILAFFIASVLSIAGCFSSSSSDNDKVPDPENETNFFQVFYNLNGGSGEAPKDDKQYTSGEFATVLPLPDSMQKKGSQAIGWTLVADETSNILKAGDRFQIGENDITLYALWQKSLSISGKVLLDNSSEISTVLMNDGTWLLPPVVVGDSYNVQLQSSETGIWSIESGTLPPGLSLGDNGLLSGTATQAGSYQITISFKTSISTQSVERQFTIVISENMENTLLPANTDLGFTFIHYILADPETGTNYDFVMGGGDSNRYTIRVKNSTLPTGFSLNEFIDEEGAHIVLNGIAESRGNFSLSIRGEDIFYLFYGDESGTHVIERTFTFIIYECWQNEQCNQDGKSGGSCNSGFCEYPPTGLLPIIETPFNNSVVLEFDNENSQLILPKLHDMQQFEIKLLATGGSNIYQWSCISGSDSLPAGVSFSADGTLSGTTGLENPDIEEYHCMDFKVESGFTSTHLEYCISIIPKISNRIAPESATLPSAVIGQEYFNTATGEPSINFGFGLGYNYTLELVSGALPNGLTMEQIPWATEIAHATISGIPTETGDFTFTVRGEDYFYRIYGENDPEMKNVIEKTYNLTVTPH